MKKIETLEKITKDYISDAIDERVAEGVKYRDWAELVGEIFEEARANNVMPGYDNDDEAFSVLDNDRVTAGEVLKNMVNGGEMEVNPFTNPTGFVVAACEALAYDMRDEFPEQAAACLH